MLKKAFCVISFLLANITVIGHSQIVQFRLEATDMSGTPISAVAAGETFLLKAYTQHVNGYSSEENSGVFAGYLDITFDGNLASTAGTIEHSTFYENGTSGDISTAGLFDDIGGFSSGGDFGFGVEPLGLGEYYLFSVPMRADSVGELSFVGRESGSYPDHDVLVYGLDEPIPVREMEVGEFGTRIDFGAVNINVVPEPDGAVLLLGGILSAFFFRRRR